MHAFLWRLWGVFIFFLMGGLLSAREVFLTSGIRTFEQTQHDGSDSRTLVTFNYGGMQIVIPRTANWTENPMLLRPQLLFLRCGPLSSPSSVHIELLADQPRASGDGLFVNLLDPKATVVTCQQEKNRVAMPSALLPGLTLASFRKTQDKDVAANAHDPFREEVHILQSGEFGLILRLVLSPQLEPKNEDAIRRSLGQLIVRASSPGGGAGKTPAAAPSQPPLPGAISNVHPSAPSPVSGGSPALAKPATQGEAETQAAAATAKSASSTESLPTTSVLVSSGAKIKKLFRRENGESAGITTLTFDYGGVVIGLPRTPHWGENATVRRPQLLGLVYRDAAAPSRAVLELAARDVTPQTAGVLVQSEDARKMVVQQGQIPGWEAVPSGIAWDPKLLLGSYRKTPPADASPTDREEVHLLQIQGVALRMRLVLAAGLPAEEEAALRAALGKLSIQITSQPSISGGEPPK